MGVIMKLKTHSNVPKFCKNVYPFLTQHEACNNLLFSILERLKEDPFRYGPQPVLITLEDEKREDSNNLKMVAIQTPPFNLILSYVEDLTVTKDLAQALFDKNFDFPGIIGPKEQVETFSNLWCSKKKVKQQLKMNQRIYQLNKVEKKYITGLDFTVATTADLPLIKKWGRDFILEVESDSPDGIENTLKRLEVDLKASMVYVLIDNKKIVSMAKIAGETPNGRPVNYVYTPPEHRNKGYATEVVACLSQKILDEGSSFCFLFTDLSNPTSNNIYQKIGYRPVVDINMVEFKA